LSATTETSPHQKKQAFRKKQQIIINSNANKKALGNTNKQNT